MVMFTTEGLTFATSAATSGVPAKRGGDANGAGVEGGRSLGEADWVVSAASAEGLLAAAPFTLGDWR
jgi:hypothetical protein